METLNFLLNGMQAVFQPMNLLFLFIGCILGQAIGVLPGIGSAAAIALLIPVTLNLPATASVIMLAGIFYGTNYGGTITSVLMNTPGESASVVTAIDGYQMAKKGRGGPALGIAAIGSFIGGTVGTLGLAFGAQWFSDTAIKIGASEYFAIMIFAVALVTVLSTGSPVKALLMCVLGLLIGTVGIDASLGIPRFTFGQVKLFDGISFIAIVIGFFGLGEILLNIERRVQDVIYTQVGSVLPNKKDLKDSAGPIARGTVIGFILGIIPGATSAIASFLSYGVEAKRAKDPSRFGKGAIEGVAGPETANNSFVNANFIPLFTLGIPGTASIAMIMSGMMANGIVPGPFLFRDNPDFVWTVIASMIIGQIILLLFNLPLVRVWILLLKIPYSILFVLILEFTLIGAYAVSFDTFNMYVMTIAGFFGYLFKKLDFPATPFVLTLVIGPLIEKNLRKSLEISSGDFAVFYQRPITLILLLAALATISWPIFKWARASFRNLQSKSN
jgi:putative tricarboxylic transport membrane protein